MGYFRPLQNPSSFRKLAAAMWRPPNDPHIFGSLDVDATPALAFLQAYNRTSQAKVTMTHLVVRAVALVLARHPELNAKVAWSRILLRSTVDIFCQIASDNGRDLSGTKIERADSLSLAELAARLATAAKNVRTQKDPSFERSRNLFRTLPLWLLRPFLRLLSFLSNTLHLHLPKLGMPRDPFGSAMVTSVGMFGIDTGFAPFTPIARCPMLVTVTKVKPRPWVVGDSVQPRPVLRLCAAFDHRVIDGAHAGQLSTEIEELFADPAALLTEAERPAWSEGSGEAR